MPVKKKSGAKINPFLISTTTTIAYVLASSILSFIRGRQFDLIETLVSAAVFWVSFFLCWTYINKRIEKR